MLKGKRRFLLISIPIILIIIFAIFGDNGLIRLYNLHNEKVRLVSRNKRLEDENRRFRKEIKMLKKDKGYIERVAREELGMIGRDETVYKFEE